MTTRQIKARAQALGRRRRKLDADYEALRAETIELMEEARGVVTLRALAVDLAVSETALYRLNDRRRDA